MGTTIEIFPAPAASAAALFCLKAYFRELNQRFPKGFELAHTPEVNPAETTPPVGQFLLVQRDGQTLGCGAVKTLAPGIAELKRMWLHQKLRGMGVGRRLLQQLETSCVELGLHTARLDTNEHLTEAIALYVSAGYREIPCYNDNSYATHWFEKRLATAPTR